jgi:hypothetical protein
MVEGDSSSGHSKKEQEESAHSFLGFGEYGQYGALQINVSSGHAIGNMERPRMTQREKVVAAAPLG